MRKLRAAAVALGAFALALTACGGPLFANAAGGDFHLTAQSPAVDHGKASAAVTDADGNPRPQGAAFDIGAYELVP
jgi:hypothetical protein